MYRLFFILFCFTLPLNQLKAQDSTSIEELSIQLAQEQLDAYNNGDIDKFLKSYSDSVKVFRFPDKLLYQGKNVMKNRYDKLFQSYPDLHAELKSRIKQGNTIIDKEYVTMGEDRAPIEAIAIYKIRQRKIQEVYFIFK